MKNTFSNPSVSNMSTATNATQPAYIPTEEDRRQDLLTAAWKESRNEKARLALARTMHLQKRYS